MVGKKKKRLTMNNALYMLSLVDESHVTLIYACRSMEVNNLSHLRYYYRRRGRYSCLKRQILASFIFESVRNFKFDLFTSEILCHSALKSVKLILTLITPLVATN